MQIVFARVRLGAWPAAAQERRPWHWTRIIRGVEIEAQ
jgi:hypothetical protein